MLKRGEGIENNTLINYHWFLLKKLSSILQLFYKATIYSQGHKHTLYRQFTIIDQLFKYLFNIKEYFKKKLQEKYGNSKEYTYLKASAFTLQEKYKQYYKYVDKSAAYYATQVLLLDNKWAQFKQQFKGDKKKKYQLRGDPKDSKDLSI